MNISKFLSNNKSMSAIAISILIVFIIGIIGNQLIDSRIKNWAESSSSNIQEIETKATQIIKFRQEKLTFKKNEIIHKFEKFSTLNFSIVDNEFSKSKNVSVSIFKNDSLFYWNDNYLEQLSIVDTQNFSDADTWFIDADINIYLVAKDNFTIGDNKYTLHLADLIEKQYQLNEDYYDKISLSDHISEQLDTEFSIEYSEEKVNNKDGRKHSFAIKNDSDITIGIATFLKPSREKSVKKLEDIIFTIQGIVVLLGFLFVGLRLWQETSKQKDSILFLFTVAIYLAVLRYLLILIKFPRNIFTSEVLSDKYYFSPFGYGLADSPLDLLITLTFVFIIFLLLFRYVLHFYSERTKRGVNLLALIFIPLGIVFYLVSLRGIGASFRGLVFDTSLRYFQNTSLAFSQPHFVMHLNALLIGLISILGSVFIIISLFTLFNIEAKKRNYIIPIILTLLFIIVEIIYDQSQNNPQLSLIIKSLHIIFVFSVAYFFTNYEFKRITKILVMFIAASVFSITSLLLYNTQLEKASLRTTANIISRVDDEWYKNLISETILSSFSRKEAIKAFSKENTNFNSAAFKIWSNSNLQSEAINSSINFISLSGELLGGFGSIYPHWRLDEFIDTNSVIEEIQIFEEPINGDSQKLIRGIFPVKDDFSFLGYFDVSILSDLNDFGFSSHPEFISAGKLNEKAILKLDKLDILDYRESELKVVYGKINPTQKLNSAIINADFTKTNDAWIKEDFNGAQYLIYVKKTLANNTDRIIAVGLKGKELTIGLFDFFKIFFTHSIFLLIILLVYILFYSKGKLNYQLDLRTRLLVAFLIISLIPLVLTALYFRNLTEEKNADAIYYKLGKRAFRVENYLNENYQDNTTLDMYEKAASDLNISYTVYRNNEMDYSSQDLLYDVGLLSKRLNPKAHNELVKMGTQEILVNESVDKYNFNSFYYKANFLDREIIIKVTDGFNNIRLPLSGSEVDVFLFGIYSLAVVLIIIFSAIFANQISLPIRKITAATKSVAAGDLSLELRSDATGELGDLVSSFKYMIKELKRNQTMLAEIEREEAWKEMAKQVAHEIKNPLTPMKLSVQQLVIAYNDKSDKFDGFFQKVTKTILNQIDTLKNIATEFSNFARMPKLKIEQIDCVSVIEQAKNLFTDEKINIGFKPLQEKYSIKGDSEQLKRILINLIRNSIQAHATTIDFILKDSDKNYELFVKDNGHGIEKEYIHKIFEPNFTTKPDGMGLGLSMAQRYLRSTGGNIIIESNSKDGITLKLIFPK